MRSFSLTVLPQFLDKAQLLSKDERSKLIKTLSLLAQDFRHPGLQTKKVRGSKESVFECRVDQDLRLIYDFASGAIRCWYVGHHDVALKFAERLVPETEVDDIELEMQDDSGIIAVMQYCDEGINPIFTKCESALFV